MLIIMIIIITHTVYTRTTQVITTPPCRCTQQYMRCTSLRSSAAPTSHISGVFPRRTLIEQSIAHSDPIASASCSAHSRSPSICAPHL